jgi:pyruvate dehydrogenase E1 component alpha subunit
MSDPGQYRTKDEVEEWKKRDPLSIGRRRLVEEAGMDEAALKSLEARVKAEIEEAVKFAEDSPPADEYAAFTYKEI